MKKMSCKELGGACDKEFEAQTFDEIAELSRQHGTKMYQKGEEDHIRKMQELRNLMKDPVDMATWMKEKKILFDSKPEL